MLFLENIIHKVCYPQELMKTVSLPDNILLSLNDTNIDTRMVSGNFLCDISDAFPNFQFYQDAARWSLQTGPPFAHICCGSNLEKFKMIKRNHDSSLSLKQLSGKEQKTKVATQGNVKFR